MVPSFQKLKDKFTDFHRRHQALVSFLVFSIGFLTDVVTIKRIDSYFNLIQQGIYIFVLGILLIVEIKKEIKGKYHDLIVHFLFGSLLSLYTIFYYSSASVFTSFVFIILIAGLMLANEVKKIRDYGLPVKIILFSICNLSFFSFLFPILFGAIGEIPFWMGFISSIIIFLLLWFLNLRNLKTQKKKLILPAIGVHLFFIFAYYTSLIPPVPMAIKKIGVYHDVQKTEGHYIGSYQPEEAFFLTRNFKVRPGDKIHILVSIFSPTYFQDKITLKWYRSHKEQGRKLEDSIPLDIFGGREEGYRGFSTKQHFSEGDWEVIVETSDNRELGRLRFKVLKDSSTEKRIFKKELF